MLRILPKVLGIVLAAIVAIAAFALWHAFQTTAEREVATLNLRILAGAVPYNGSWTLAIFNLGPAANITGVWTDKGFEPLGKVLGRGQNATLQLANQPLKLQACAVGHASACELVKVAGWAIHSPDSKRIPMANVTIKISVDCTWVDLRVYGAGLQERIEDNDNIMCRPTTKTYVIPTAFPLYVVAHTGEGNQYSKILLPGESYSLYAKEFLCKYICVGGSGKGGGGGGGGTNCPPRISLDMKKHNDTITTSADVDCAEHGDWMLVNVGFGDYVLADACTTLSGELSCLGLGVPLSCGDDIVIGNGSSITIKCE